MNTEKIITDCAQFFANVADDEDYIFDAISKFCDVETPIYNGDLLEFVSENPSALAGVIDDGLYDPRNDYNFFGHAQAAFYWQCEQIVYENLDDICARAVMYGHDVSYRMQNAIYDAMENVDNNLTFSELHDIAKDAIAQYWQEQAKN